MEYQFDTAVTIYQYGVAYAVDVSVKYKILPGNNYGMDQTNRAYPSVEIKEALIDGRDVRWLLDGKTLEQEALYDYFKTEQQ